MKRVAFMTLGCKTNLVESDAIMGVLAEEGFEIVNFDDEADYYVVNTCTVTHVSDRKSRQMIRRARKKSQDAKVICMGCYTQLNFEEVQKMDVDLVLGNGNKNLVIDYIRSGGDIDSLTDVEMMTKSQPVSQGIFHVEELEADHNITIIDDLKTFEEIPLYTRASHTRAFIKIQDGCDRYCTYCIIPRSRGTIRSRSLKSIREEVEHLVKSGYTEFVLTGIHMASYGNDYRIKQAKGESCCDEQCEGVENCKCAEQKCKQTLLDVIETVDAVDGVRRIRLGSLEPKTVTEEFEERMSKCTKLCDHFHLSLQSGSDNVLKLMNRRYTIDEFKMAVRRLRNIYKNPSLTTDVIVGFPGETEEDFETTLNFVMEIGLSDIHIFPYSERSGTPAVKFKNKVANEEKKRRARELEHVTSKLREKYLSLYKGEELEVLIEENDGGISRGYTSNYIYVTSEDYYETGTYHMLRY